MGAADGEVGRGRRARREVEEARRRRDRPRQVRGFLGYLFWRFYDSPAVGGDLCSFLQALGRALHAPSHAGRTTRAPRSAARRQFRTKSAGIGSSASDATHAPVTVSLSFLPPSAPSAVLVLARSRSLIIAPARCVRCMQPQLAVWGVPVNRLVRKRFDAGSLVVSRACRSSSEWLKNIKHNTTLAASIWQRHVVRTRH